MLSEQEEKEMILKELEPLFEKARKEKLLFRSGYQSILFHPDDLAREQKEGRFIWGAVNWTLESPKKELDYLESAVRNAKHNLQNFKAKLAKWGYDDPSA